MKIKFCFIFLVISLVTLSSSAQSKLSWGLEGGLNLSNAPSASTPSLGFNLGAFGQMQLRGNWFLDAGLKLSSAPWKQNQVGSATPYSLMIPVHAGYSFRLSNSSKLFVAAGPYLGIGLWGKGKWQFNTPDSHTVDNVYKDEGLNFIRMARVQAGIDAKIGMELSDHYRVSLGYQYQINNTARSMCPIKHAQVFSVNVGYRF